MQASTLDKGVYAFTGPSRLSRDQSIFVIEDLLTLPEPRIVRTGAAPGLDTEVAKHAIDYWPHALHELYVPDADHNEDIVKFFLGLPKKTKTRIVWMRPGASPASAYRQRNEAMINGSDGWVHTGPRATMLHAYLRSLKFYRSGEWMTVNIAKGLRVPTRPTLLPVGGRMVAA